MSGRKRYVLVLTEYYYPAEAMASGRIMTEMAVAGWLVARNVPACVTQIPGTVGLEMPFEDLVAVRCACGRVIAQRRGLSDVILERVSRLTVLHTIDMHIDPLPHDSRNRFYGVVESGQDSYAEELFLCDDLDEEKARAPMSVRGDS